MRDRSAHGGASRLRDLSTSAIIDLARHPAALSLVLRRGRSAHLCCSCACCASSSWRATRPAFARSSPCWRRSERRWSPPRIILFGACCSWRPPCISSKHDAQPETFGSIPAAMWWAIADDHDGRLWRRDAAYAGRAAHRLGHHGHGLSSCSACRSASSPPPSPRKSTAASSSSPGAWSPSVPLFATLDATDDRRDHALSARAVHAGRAR